MSARTPLSEHQLSGTNLTRALKYDAPTEPPTFVPGVPSEPEDLTAPEKKIWKRIVGILEARNTLTAGDGAIIERYAVLSVRWRTEKNVLEAEGVMIERFQAMGKQGLGIYSKEPNPRLRVIESCERELTRLDVQLGLSPCIFKSHQR
jgi:P27 family predicted phage terminase small subunit